MTQPRHFALPSATMVGMLLTAVILLCAVGAAAADTTLAVAAAVQPSQI